MQIIGRVFHKKINGIKQKPVPSGADARIPYVFAFLIISLSFPVNKL